MLRRWLQKAPSFYFVSFAMLAAFGAYFCMYAYRKPFTVATFEGLNLWGLDFKIWLIIAQVAGYVLSKFIGIKVISELGRGRGRLFFLVGLILAAETALFFFALVPVRWKLLCLFFNGLPLGMIWGIVFSYLEGRRFSEILGAGLSVSFIVSSGAVKSVGKWVMDSLGYSEFWMPFVSGLIFLPFLLIFGIMLEQIPPPTQEDELLRSPRRAMTRHERRQFISTFAAGILTLVLFYVGLTAYRDFRDNFAVELWTALGYGDAPSIFTLAELPIALIVLVALGLTMFIRDNRRAFLFYHWIILGNAGLIGISTLLFQAHLLPPAAWMIAVGLGLYTAYVPFNCILFDRMLAAFKIAGNAGFMIYVADAFGYLGSVFVLLYKNFGQADLSWLQFFIYASYGLAIFGLALATLSLFYFRSKFLTFHSNNAPAAQPVVGAGLV